jgi:hypothetical protein
VRGLDELVAAFDVAGDHGSPRPVPRAFRLALGLQADGGPVAEGGRAEVVVGPPHHVDTEALRLEQVGVHAGHALAEAAVDVHRHRHRAVGRSCEGTRGTAGNAERAEADQTAGPLQQ